MDDMWRERLDGVRLGQLPVHIDLLFDHDPTTGGSLHNYYSDLLVFLHPKETPQRNEYSFVSL